jgi:hypothetical protein
MLFLAAGLLLFDVAVRRLAFDADATAEHAKYVWARLRGFPVPPPAQTAAVLRLRARPADAIVSGGRAARRFEGGPVSAVPGFADASAPDRPAPRRPAAGKPADLAPGQEAPAPAAAESLEALQEAKKRVWDERKKDKS